MSEFYTNVKVIGNSVCYRGIKDGKKVKYKVDYRPTLFVSAKEETKYKTLFGEYVDEICPGNIKETRDFIKKYEDVQGFNIYGNEKFETQYISDKYSSEIPWTKDEINIYSLDIETTSEEGFPSVESAIEQILLITIKDNTSKAVTTFGFKDYNNSNNINYIQCQDEYSMLKRFVEFWERNPPDVITGWNINGFDIPFLVRRIMRVLGEDYSRLLSPWGRVNEKTTFDKNGKELLTYSILGISILDYMDLYLKFSPKKQEFYSLDFIAEAELGEKKLDHSEFDTFKEFYTNDWNKFVDYNIIDVELVDKLEDKLKLIELCLAMAYDAKINYEDVFSQVRMWDAIIYNHLREKNVVIPKKKSEKKVSFEGAFVKDPLVGYHKWIVSFDATSLYPSIIQSFNISPETFIDFRGDITLDSLFSGKSRAPESCSLTANGAIFSNKNKGMFGEIVDVYMAKRKSAKTKMLEQESKLEKLKQEKDSYTKSEYNDIIHKIEKLISTYNNAQMAYKIALNSLYGASGNEHFRYFNLEIARAITLTGQFIIQSVERGLNTKLNEIFKTNNYQYCFYCDTDSVYIRLEPVVEKYCSGKTTEETIQILDKLCSKTIGKLIDDICEEFQVQLNSYRRNISFKREAISDKGIWMAKKRYILNVHNSEGVQYAKPKMKVMGLEMIKTSTPQYVRDKMKETVEKIIYEDEESVQKYIAEVRKEFTSLDPSMVSFPRGMNGLKKYANSQTTYIKGTPIHVKGALIYNKLLKEYNLEAKYPKIIDGDKIRFACLKTPNHCREQVISFHRELPKEFNLHDYIDYNTQFETAYLKPMTVILNTIGWSHEKTISVEDFF